MEKIYAEEAMHSRLMQATTDEDYLEFYKEYLPETTNIMVPRLNEILRRLKHAFRDAHSRAEVEKRKVDELERRLDVLYSEAARVEIENRALRRELDSVRNTGDTGTERHGGGEGATPSLPS